MGKLEEPRTSVPLLLDQQDPADGGDHINIGGECRNGFNGDSENSSATGYLVFSTIVAATCSFNSGFCFGYSSPAEPGILADLNLSMAEYSVFGSILAVGGMMGSVFSGKIAEFFGRRTAMWIVNIFFLVGWLAVAFAKDAWLLDLGRLLQGVGIALTSYVGNVFIAEITPKNLRGRLMTANPLMTGSGVAIAYVIGSVVNWRHLALIGCVPCFLQILCLFFIPESPRWLVKNGHEREFETSLQLLRGRKADISQEAAEIKEFTKSIQFTSEDKILNLFQQMYARPIIVATGLMMLSHISGLNGFTFYTSNIFYLANMPARVGYVAVAVVQILGTTLALLSIDRFGRRTLLMVSAAGACFGSLLTGLSFASQGLHAWASILVLTGVMVFLVSFHLGIAGIPWIIISEIFPMNVKGAAGSVCNLVYWFCSWVVSYTFNFLLEWSSAGTFLMFASVSGFGVLFIAKLVPETKGRSLEDIQASITYVLP